jgi:hypothetical protein
MFVIENIPLRNVHFLKSIIPTLKDFLELCKRYDDDITDEFKFLGDNKKSVQEERKEQYDKIVNFCNEMISNNGSIKREYLPSNSSPNGRLFCSHSAQTIWKPFRGLLMSHTTDIDMKNAHPVILAYLCKKNNISSPYLNEYINRRDAILDEFSSRDKAKKLFLAAINKEKTTRDVSNKFFNRFDKEIREIQQDLLKLPDFVEVLEQVPASKTFNRVGSAINRILCEYENNILMVMAKTIKKNDVEIASLMFDGLMVNGNFYNNPEFLKTLEDKIEKKFPGLNMKLSYKEHDTTITIPETYSIETDNDDDTFNEDQFTIRDSRGQIYCGTYEVVKKAFEEKFAYIPNSECYIQFENIGTSKQTFKTYKNKQNFKDLVAPYQYVEINSVMDKKTGKVSYVPSKQQSFFSKWMIDPERRTFNGIVRNLDPSFNDTTYFNTWTGFPILNSEPSTDDKQWQEWLELMNDYFLTIGGDEEHIANLLKHFVAQMIQEPHKKYPLTPLFYGSQGAGKSSFGQFCKNIFGKPNHGEKSLVVDCPEFEGLFSQFNENMQSAILCPIEEISFETSKPQYSKFKAHTASTEYKIEIKCGAKYEIDNTIRLILISNNTVSIKLDENERRILAIKVSDRHLQDHAFFNKLYKYLENPNLMRRTFDYFKNEVDISKTNFKQIPETKYSKDLKEHFSNPMEEWVRELSETFIDGDDEYKSTDLCEIYNDWAQKRRLSSISNTSFSTKIKQNAVLTKLFTWKKTKICNKFVVNKEEYIKYMDEYEKSISEECLIKDI